MAKSRVADQLSEGPRPVHDLAAAVGADASALYRVMRALASVGVYTDTAPGHFALTGMGTRIAACSVARAQARSLAAAAMALQTTSRSSSREGPGAGRGLARSSPKIVSMRSWSGTSSSSAEVRS